MSPTETAAILRQFNEWLRGDRYDIAAPTTREMGEAIDAAVEMIERLEAAEKSDAESIAMYRKARDERDELRAKIETAENDAAHQKALAASALRVAEGWERKCGELRAKVEATPTIPEGWKLVPIEPTMKMARACASASRAYMQEYGGNSPQVMWAAMLAAAPEVRP